MKYRALKLLCLNLGIALLNVIMFSKGLVGLTFDGGALSTALAVTVIVMSLIAFGYGNYTLLFSEKPEPTVQLLRGTEFTEPKDYIEALAEKRGKGVFDEDIHTAIEQINRMTDKDKALDSILEQFFTPQEITFTRFQSAINAVQAIFYNNVKKMLNRMIIFDYKDYQKLAEKVRNSQARENGGLVSRSVDTQMRIYSEHIFYVRGLVSQNEEILIKMDALLLEISKLDDLDEHGLENMAAVQEINDLIAQTKYYKT
ncbi:MAG: hypothetical protein VZR73_06970 [Acutalibacteraceae bacterium]|nr:hypothetical protein [Acutalibacteraceae bacterium]HCA55089.1 hypothetical protein [Oscillospiraceae bacterium]